MHIKSLKQTLQAIRVSECFQSVRLFRMVEIYILVDWNLREIELQYLFGQQQKTVGKIGFVVKEC